MLKSAIGFALCAVLLVACKDGDKKESKGDDTVSSSFTGLFKEVKAPYQLSDTALAKNSDTTSIPSALVSSFISDSIRTHYFGKGTAFKYVAIAKLVQKEKESYYLIKVSGGSKKAVFLLVFDKQEAYAATYPFLLPDASATTTQVSSIDKNFTITRAVTQRAGSDIIGEGKEVVAYDAALKSFSLIMQDALNDASAELVNPIDTFPKTNKLAGDYYLNKKNIVAVRDGRHPSQLLVYIHTENEAGDCKGELKGEFLITSPTVATYRLGGDPCVLGLSFSGNTVTIKEETGCGNHRDLDCPLSGSFTRKKIILLKQNSKKGKGK